jgi:hypothetical protein
MARLAGVLLAIALLGPAAARADADPASDVLYTGRVFLPLSVRVSPELARGDPGGIPLARHTNIVLALGGYVPPHPRYLFP